jgi:hypothetical protein
MRIVIVALAAGLALAGCSEKTGESAQSAVENAASDTASNLDVASSAVSSAASDIGDNDETSATSTSSATSDGTTTTTTTEKKTY